MKNLLLAACLLIAVPAVAQKPAPAPPIGQEAAQPFKLANVIIIHTSDSATTAYKRIASALLGAGYTFDRADKELGFLNTKSRPAPKLNVAHIVRVAIFAEPTGARVELRDALTMPGVAATTRLGAGETETQFRGMKGSPVMICWEELQRVATLYPDGKLAYKQQP